MSEHKATLKWERGGAEFSYQKYPRDHTWSFDGGHTMTATAAPAYLGNPANVDPEEAFVASLASCHMLTFLSIACKQKFVLDSYEDEAVGHMEKNADGKLAITRVELRPKITWSGNRRPSAEELDKMHHAAHENCFIANSVKTKVTVAERIAAVLQAAAAQSIASNPSVVAGIKARLVPLLAEERLEAIWPLLRLGPSQCLPFRQVSDLPRAYPHILYRRSAQCVVDLYRGRVCQSQIPRRGRRSTSTCVRSNCIARSASLP